MNFKAYILNGISFTGLGNASLEEITDKKYNRVEYILGEHQGSLLISQHKTTDKGVDCTQWFDMTNKFNKERFNKI